MENKTLILLFTSLIPLFTALVGAIIEGISIQDSVTIREKRAKKMLMCYFIIFIFIGSGVSTGIALPEITIQIWPLTVFALYLAPVLYYRFICILTDIENKDIRSFNKHYLFPLFAGIGCCTIYYIVPSPIYLQLVVDKTTGSYPVTTFIFQTIPAVQFILTGIYMLLAVRKLANRYNQHTDNPMWTKWFHLSIILCSLSFIWSGAFLFTIWRQTAVWALSVAIAAAWIQTIYLCCDTFNRKSLLFLPLFNAPELLKNTFHDCLCKHENNSKKYRTYMCRTLTVDTIEAAPVKLNRNLFEKEVIGNKWYLKPQLRLSELTEVFNTNRTYLSGFINQTYGCRFNEYINRLRLRELERLLSLPDNQGKSAQKLYSKAGFLSYRTYLRIKKTVYNENIRQNTTT